MAAMRDHSRERAFQLAQAEAYKDFQEQLLQFKTCYEELKAHSDTLEASNQALLQEAEANKARAAEEQQTTQESHSNQVA